MQPRRDDFNFGVMFKIITSISCKSFTIGKHIKRSTEFDTS